MSLRSWRVLEEVYNPIILPWDCEHKSESVQKPWPSFEENISFNNEEEEISKDEEDTQIKTAFFVSYSSKLSVDKLEKLYSIPRHCEIHGFKREINEEAMIHLIIPKALAYR